MPYSEAPFTISESTSSRTSFNELTSSDSESFSDHDFEINSTNPVTNLSNSELDFTFLTSNNYSLLGDKLRLPIELNLKQLLIQVTETEDLQSVNYLRLQVIAQDFSLQRLPIYLPNLYELNLNESCLMSLRDLGCRMQSLTILHVCHTGLNSLDGLFGLSGLIELYAANNNIKDVSPCSALNQIKILDVANNVIKDANAVSFLMLCTTLKKLNLHGNPATTIDNYRDSIKELLPNLKSLDGIDYIDSDRSVNTSLESLNLEDITPTKIISRFPPIFPRDNGKENIGKKIKLAKRPHTTGSMDTSKKYEKLLPIRPSTARNVSHNDFACIVKGANLKLKDIHQMFTTIGKPICSNHELSLSEKKNAEEQNKSK